MVALAFIYVKPCLVWLTAIMSSAVLSSGSFIWSRMFLTSTEGVRLYYNIFLLLYLIRRLAFMDENLNRKFLVEVMSSIFNFVSSFSLP